VREGRSGPWLYYNKLSIKYQDGMGTEDVGMQYYRLQFLLKIGPVKTGLH